MSLKTRAYRVLVPIVAILMVSKVVASELTGPEYLPKQLVEAQVATPTEVGGYPSPVETPVTPADSVDGSDNGYPVGVPESTTQLQGGYPVATSANLIGVTPDSQNFATTGAPAIDAELPASQLPQDDNNTPERRSNSLLLWLGFMMALIIFIVGVVGSIILFARQRMNGNQMR